MNKIIKIMGVVLLSIFLGSCQENQATDSSSQASSSQKTSSSETTAVETQSTELGGTYVLEETDEVKILTIKDGTGSLESRENDDEVDGNQDIYNKQ